MNWKMDQISGKLKSSLFEIGIDVINLSVFVDRYVKDLINILSVQFSPNGRFLATGANDTQIRVCSFKTRILFNLIVPCLDMGYHHKTNASHVYRPQSSLQSRLLS